MITNVDTDKIRNYFEIQVAVRNRSKGDSLYSMIPFRRCRQSDTDFSSKNIDFTKFLCPDFTDLNKDLYTVQNYYNNLQDRVSFSLEVAKCSSYSSKQCKSQEEKDRFFKAIYFSFNVVNQVHNFFNSKKLLMPIIKFHTQFQLST